MKSVFGSYQFTDSLRLQSCGQYLTPDKGKRGRERERSATSLGCPCGFDVDVGVCVVQAEDRITTAAKGARQI